MSPESLVKARYPRATASSDYNNEACWTFIYDGHDEDGIGDGEVIGRGQFEAEAWADAAERIQRENKPAASGGG